MQMILNKFKDRLQIPRKSPQRPIPRIPAGVRFAVWILQTDRGLHQYLPVYVLANYKARASIRSVAAARQEPRSHGSFPRKRNAARPTAAWREANKFPAIVTGKRPALHIFDFWNRHFDYYIGIGEYTPFDL